MLNVLDRYAPKSKCMYAAFRRVVCGYAQGMTWQIDVKRPRYPKRSLWRELFYEGRISSVILEEKAEFAW